MPFDFPHDIRLAIQQACRNAKTHYGATFIHCDDGTPTASVGRLSGGLLKLGVYDDLIVGPHEGRWGVWGDRCQSLGIFTNARELRVGLRLIIRSLYPRRSRRRDPGPAQES